MGKYHYGPTPRRSKDVPSKMAVVLVCGLIASLLIGCLWAGSRGYIDIPTEAEQRPTTYRTQKDTLNRVYISEELIGYTYVDVDPETGVQTKLYIFPDAKIGFGVPRLDKDGTPMVGTVPGAEPTKVDQ